MVGRGEGDLLAGGLVRFGEDAARDSNRRGRRLSNRTAIWTITPGSPAFARRNNRWRKPMPDLDPSPTPLIERARLFGNPSRMGGQLSPDGRWLSWLAPKDGVLNVWTAPVSDPGSGKAITDERVRPIRAHAWSPDSARVLFVNDQGGDENFKLFGVPAAGGETVTLTPFDKTQAQILKISRQHKDRILVGLNNRDPRWHDVHSLELSTGRLGLVFENTGFGGFVFDDDLAIRFGSRPRPDGGTEYYRFKAGALESEPFIRVDLDDAATTHPIRYTRDGRTLYWIDSRGRDTAALIAEDVASGARQVLGEDPRADVQGAGFNPQTGVAEAYPVTYLKTEWHALGDAVAGDFAFLQAELDGEVAVTSRTDADDLWTVAADPVTAPPAVYLYERATRKLTQLYVSRPELEGAPLAPLHPVEIRARDGLVQVSYLTLPPGSDPDRTGRPKSPVPMVLLPHGGPWARDGYGFNPQHQFLANRGYAVLSPNFRGSTGFGKRHLSAGYLQWGGTMHEDLLDAVAWAVAEGITTADKVGIMGGSYGGYCVLAGLAFTPEVFACGVDIVGPANLNTLLAAIPPYWEAMRIQLHKRVGDPTTPEGAALLTERSPLTRADQIRRPLLIGQGANDPRVAQAESDQIVGAMEAKQIPVTYVLFPDEGHGFGRPENALAFFAITEHFLAANLAGRAEPYGDVLEASSATVPHGAGFAPGLTEALAGK
jgi:dipeptidyl aminopeptidase/acylaminoacyl peptidase